jgi:hypothetical protein
MNDATHGHGFTIESLCGVHNGTVDPRRMRFFFPRLSNFLPIVRALTASRERAIFLVSLRVSRSCRISDRRIALPHLQMSLCRLL